MRTLASRALLLLDDIGTWLPQLGLRLLLAYEFWQSGLEKYHGENWFEDIQDQFPFPLSLVPPDVSWHLATSFELIGPIALVLGLGTRFFSASLIILTFVAWTSVHAGNGYNVCDNGYKLPLMYVVMFLAPLFSGPGRISLDHLIRARWTSASSVLAR